MYSINNKANNIRLFELRNSFIRVKRTCMCMICYGKLMLTLVFVPDDARLFRIILLFLFFLFNAPRVKVKRNLCQSARKKNGMLGVKNVTLSLISSEITHTKSSYVHNSLLRLRQMLTHKSFEPPKKHTLNKKNMRCV